MSNKIKILKISVINLPLFKKKVEFDFTSDYSVSDFNNDGLCRVFSDIYSNNVISIIGINASGKTSLLKVLSFSIELLNGIPISNNHYLDILNNVTDKQSVIFENYFYLNGKVYYLNISIRCINGHYYIEDEILRHRSITNIKSKDELFDLSNWATDFVRNGEGVFLTDDVSIINTIANKQKPNINYYSMFQIVDTNILLEDENVPKQLLNFLDPTIEYLNVQTTRKNIVDIHLKFNNKKKLTLNNLTQLNHYLSSGVIKGIILYLQAKKMFIHGGYIFIDGIENHLDRGVVKILIQFFLDKEINYAGATLLFSTHSADLLDELDRNDSIYIIRNDNGISVDNLAILLEKEVDDKSDVYYSNFLGGTALKYENYIKLRDYLLYDKK